MRDTGILCRIGAATLNFCRPAAQIHEQGERAHLSYVAAAKVGKFPAPTFIPGQPPPPLKQGSLQAVVGIAPQVMWASERAETQISGPAIDGCMLESTQWIHVEFLQYTGHL